MEEVGRVVGFVFPAEEACATAIVSKQFLFVVSFERHCVESNEPVGYAQGKATNRTGCRNRC